MEMPIPEDLQALSERCRKGEVDVVCTIKIGTRHTKTVLVGLLRQLIERIAKAEQQRDKAKEQWDICFKGWQDAVEINKTQAQQIQAQQEEIERLKLDLSRAIFDTRLAAENATLQATVTRLEGKLGEMRQLLLKGASPHAYGSHVRPDVESCQHNAAKEPEGERLRNELEAWLESNKIVGILMDTKGHFIDICNAPKLPPNSRPVLSHWGAISVETDEYGTYTPSRADQESKPSKAAEHNGGAFVLYPDYDRAVGRADALELQVTHWQNEAKSYKPAWDAVKAENATLRADNKALLEALEMCERCITELYPADGYEEEHNAEWYAVNKVLNAARAAIAHSERQMNQERKS